MNRFAAVGILLFTVFIAGVAVPLSAQVQDGVVVEKVTRRSAADKSGIAEGDVLVSWSRPGKSGKAESPFDLLRMEVEDAPLGPIVITGSRAGETKTWSLGQEAWGLKVRPNLGGHLLESYQAATPKPSEGKAAGPLSAKDQMQAWLKLAADARGHGEPAWLTSWLLLHAAEAMGATKDWDLADQACQDALAASADTPNTLPLLKACSDIFYLRESGQVRSLKYLQLALAKAQKENPRSLTTAALLSSVARVQQNNLAKATEIVLQAIDIQEKVAPGTLALAFNYNRAGVFYQNSGNLDLAKKYIRRSLDIREKLIPDSIVLSTTLENYGDTLSISGDLDEAVKYQQRACSMREKIEPPNLALAACYVDEGTAEDNRSNYAAAEDYFQRALAIQKTISPRGGGAGAALNNLGNVQHERGQLLEAEKSFTQAYSIFQEVVPDSLESAVSLSNLGMINTDLGRNEQAEKFLHQTLELREKLAPNSAELGITYDSLGDLSLQRGEFAKAKEFYEKAIAALQASIPKGFELGDSYQGLGQVFEKTSDLNAAEKNYAKALEIRSRILPGSSKHAQTLMSMARVKYRSGDLAASSELFQRAMAALDSQTSRLGGGEQTLAGFRAMFEDGSKAYVDLLIAKGEPEKAFQVVERLHARTLLETLSAARVEIHQGASASLLADARNLETQISSKSNARLRLISDEQTAPQAAMLEKEIAALLEREQELQRQIRKSYPAYSSLTQPQPVSASEAQKLLDANTTLLEYSLGEDHSYVFALTASTLKVVKLTKKDDIENQARVVYQVLTERNRAVLNESDDRREKRWAESAKAYDAAAGELSNVLLGPAGQLELGKRILIVADGALHYVPFAALPEPASAKAQPLVVNHEVVNLPSTSVLAFLRQQYQGRTPPPQSVAILADPVFEASDERVAAANTAKSDHAGPTALQTSASSAAPSSSDELLTRSASDTGLIRDGGFSLARLRFSRQEADAIYAVTPRSKSLEATDFQASRATALSPELANYRIIHFATHGLLDSQHPELSGLVFSLVDQTGKPQDGFLTLQDIYNLSLPADLVVLSACETGLGKEISGEGLIGLTRGFMYAGATRVVASLWNVSDVATAKLMAEFYRSMEKDGLAPAAALRAAQIKMLQQKRWASPYYWAGFQIQGEWK